MSDAPSAAETRRWLEANGLTAAVRQAAAELPAELPARVVEMLREARSDRRRRLVVEVGRARPT